MRKFLVSLVAIAGICSISFGQSIIIGNPMTTTNAYFAFPHTAALNKGTVQFIAGQNATNNATDTANTFCSNGMYSSWQLFTGGNITGGVTTASVDYVEMRAVATNAFGGSESGALDFYVMTTGVLTKVGTFSASGLAIPGNLTVTGSSVTNNNGSSLTNLTAGNIAGNIAKAAITNALASAGNTIGGNIPLAALTNAYATGISMVFTNASWNGGVTTGNITFVNGVMTAFTHTP